MDLKAVADTCLLGLATATISQTSARSKVFAPVREWATKKNKWLGELAGCPYCTSHWVAFGLVIIYQPRLLNRFLPLDLLMAAFVIVALSAFIGGGIGYLTFAPVEPPAAPSEYDLPEEAPKRKII